MAGWGTFVMGDVDFGGLCTCSLLFQLFSWMWTVAFGIAVVELRCFSIYMRWKSSLLTAALVLMVNLGLLRAFRIGIPCWAHCPHAHAVRSHCVLAVADSWSLRRLAEYWKVGSRTTTSRGPWARPAATRRSSSFTKSAGDASGSRRSRRCDRSSASRHSAHSRRPEHRDRRAGRPAAACGDENAEGAHEAPPGHDPELSARAEPRAEDPAEPCLHQPLERSAQQGRRAPL